MTIAFTLCSNNYLAQAKVLGDSFRKHHPDIEFIIGLVDTFHPSINYSHYDDFTIIQVSDLRIPEFDDMEQRYNLVELNTSVKPFYFSHLFNLRRAAKIIYLDPDIEVFSRFNEVLDLLDIQNIILTPQNMMPIDDGDAPSDIHILGTGIFNLGFLALSDHCKIDVFLQWWTKRLVKYGYADERNNMFFDQVWMNLVPVFFENYHILKHPGYNMAPSNLHERSVTGRSSNYWIINENHKLRFYHYSGFKITQPEIICSYSTRHTFGKRSDIAPLYHSYLRALNDNYITELQLVQPHYCQASKQLTLQNTKIKRGLKRFLRAVRILTGRMNDSF